MRDTWRGLFVVGLLGAGVAGAQPRITPVDCGTADCEVIRDMRTLFEKQTEYLQERDRYSADLEAIRFQPAACVNGGRAPVPATGWVSGCRFSYRVTRVSTEAGGYSYFTAIAQGAEGTDAAGVRVEFTQPVAGTPVFSLQDSRGRRRYVNLDECLPAASFTCAAQLREGMKGIRDLYISERAFFQEKDRYSANFQELNFYALGCTDLTSTPVPDPQWKAGCRFVYHVALKPGTEGFTLTARSVSGASQGTTLRMEESGMAVTVSGLPPDCF